MRPARLGAAFLIVMLEACSSAGGGNSTPSGPAPGFVPKTSALGKITHVVVIVQENRSLRQYVSRLSECRHGERGATSKGISVSLQPVSMTEGYDLSHDLDDYNRSYDGGAMDGFDRGTTGTVNTGGTNGTSSAPPNAQYAYLSPSDTAPYFALASSYVLADRFFTSQLDSSFVAHQYLIAAQAGGAVNNPSKLPWGCDTPAGSLVPTLTAQRTLGNAIVPCFSYRTLGDELDTAGLPWHYYAPAIGGDVGQIWSATTRSTSPLRPAMDQLGDLT